MLEDIKLPNDLKKLSINDLQYLCKDIREEIVKSVSINGGHLSSNLGVVELTVMLHYVFDLPKDKVLFDVSHQCYTHKILSGRKLDNLRQLDSVSGFYNPSESDYDPYYTGHSSTSISTAMGMAISRDIKKEDNEIVVVIGDGALANGVAMEAINNLLSLNTKVIIIVNDNGMAISKSVGGLSKFLGKIKKSKYYQNGKRRYVNMFNRGKIRKFFFNCSARVKNSFKKLVWKDNFLENIGLDYLGVIDGHNLNELKDALEIAKNNKNSIIVHVKTIKGQGYEVTSNDSDGKWHGVNEFDLNTFTISKGKVCFNDLISNYLINNIENKNIFVISSAMKSGSKLDEVFNKYPDRCFDVGISEEHAFVFANGLALNSGVPYISIYSTFMQRCYDFINQDLLRNNSKCVIGVDRVGLVGQDGDSHHGIFDVAMVNHLPNTMICMPIYSGDVNKLMDICFNYDYLSFIRICKNCKMIENDVDIRYGKWNYLYRKENSKKVILSVGPITSLLIEKIKERNLNIDVVGVYFYKPLDEEMLKDVSNKYDEIWVYDIYSVKEGLFLPILNYYNSIDYKGKVSFYGLENKFYKQGKYNELLKYYKLDVDSALEKIF